MSTTRTTASNTARNGNERRLTARFTANNKDLDFKASKCLFLVSVGKENFENDALTAQLSLINGRFGSCLILAADTLQCYNHISESILEKKEISSDDAEKKAASKGTEWVQRYSNKIKEGLNNVSHETKTWDVWRKDKEFDANKKIVEAELDKKGELWTALKESSTEYTDRFISTRREKFDALSLEDKGSIRNRIEENCRNYLTDECAVLLMISKDKTLNCQYIVYPGKATAILNACYNLLIAPEHPDQLQWLTVRLEKKPQALSTNVPALTAAPTVTLFPTGSYQRNLQTINQTTSKTKDSDTVPDPMKLLVQAATSQVLVLSQQCFSTTEEKNLFLREVAKNLSSICPSPSLLRL